MLKWIAIAATGTVVVAGGTFAVYKLVANSSGGPSGSSVIPTSSYAPSSAATTPTTTASASGNTSANASVAGEYWCLSYNYNGAGGSCSLQAHLVLTADGGWTFGSDSGTYTYAGGKITFGGGLASRGPATYTADKQIRWEFTAAGAPYTITYYLRNP